MSGLKLKNCKDCESCFIITDNETEKSWEPTQRVVKLITDVYTIFNNQIAACLTIDHFGNQAVIAFEKGIKNIDWLDCTRHALKTRRIIFPLLARIFISRFIALSVRKYKTFQSRVGNAAKIAQQTDEYERESEKTITGQKK